MSAQSLAIMLSDLFRSEEASARYTQDPDAVSAQYGLSDEEREKLKAKDIGGLYVRGVHLTRTGEAGLDHGFLTCLHYMTPDWDLSYVWLIQNCVLPPLPSVKRCYDFGRMVGNAIRAWDSPRRVALLGTGGLSHDVGTPDMGRVDEAFDTRLLAVLCDITDAEMDARGNGAHEIRNWIALAGAVNGAKGEVILYENALGCGSGMMRYHMA